MYKKLENISEEKIKWLEAIQARAKMRSYPIRLGMNGPDVLSVYTYSKWYDWTSSDRQAFKSCFKKEYSNNAIVGWFLNFPAHEGFLDKVDYWVGARMAGNIIAYATTDAEIVINDKIVKLHRGEGVTFSLREYHEVRKSATEANWACLMTLKSFI